MFKKFKEFDLNDLLMVTGIGLVGAGVWQIFVPAAFIVIGAGLFHFGWRGYRASSGGRKQ